MLGGNSLCKGISREGIEWRGTVWRIKLPGTESYQNVNYVMLFALLKSRKAGVKQGGLWLKGHIINIAECNIV